MPRIRELHAETEKRIGMKMDLPEVGDRAILGYWVVERDGVMIKGWYEEMGIEHVEFGQDAEGTAEVRGFQEHVFQMAGDRGARVLHCLVPPAIDSRIARFLFWCLRRIASRASRRVGRHLQKSGFTMTGFMHYSRQLR
jgi:hypothetical protein